MKKLIAEPSKLLQYQVGHLLFHSNSLKLTFSLFCLVGNLVAEQALCQTVLPDATLGNNRTRVSPGMTTDGSSVDQIDGGLRQEANLFHSFTQFGIAENQRVYFANPQGVENIFSRVTSGSQTEIFGTLGVFGNANLFLMNPNGILFGENSSLDISGSFIATTANAIGFESFGIFSTDPLEAIPLLTVNPSALIFNQVNSSSIRFLSSNAFPGNSMAPSTRNSLILAGGSVSIEGATIEGALKHVEIGGLADIGEVALRVEDSDLVRLDFPDNLTRANVSIANSAINVSRNSLGNLEEGSISISAREVSLNNVQLSGTTTNEDFVESISIDAQGIVSIFLSNLSGSNVTSSASDSGNISIRSNGPVILQNSTIESTTEGQGNAGDIEIDADSVSMSRSNLQTSTQNSGNAGRISLRANNDILINNRSVINATTQSASDSPGDGGEITSSSRNFSLMNGSQISVITAGSGDAGGIIIRARENIAITENSRVSSGSFTSPIAPQSLREGRGGNISIRGDSFILRDSNLVSLTLTEGSAGDIYIQAPSSVEILAVNPSILTGSFRTVGLLGVTALLSEGSAGRIDVETTRLNIQGPAQISASTFTSGNGGGLTISSNRISLLGSVEGQGTTGLFTDTRGAGSSGSIVIRPYDAGSSLEINFENQSRISASTSGIAVGGNVTITAPELIVLRGQGTISAESRGPGTGGSVKFETRNLDIQDGTQITVSSLGESTAGTLVVQARDVLLSDQVSLSAQTQAGLGGNISLRDVNSLTVSSSQISAATESGQAGSLTLNSNDLPAGSVRLSANGAITVGASQSGNSGSLIINARNVSLQEGSQISASTVSGDGGSITLQGLENLSVTNAQISASTEDGTAGNLTVNHNEVPAQSIVVRGLLLNDQGQLLADNEGQPIRASLAVRATKEGGRAGDLRISTDLLRVENGAEISVESLAGQAGILSILAESVVLDQGLLNAETAVNPDNTVESANISLSNFALLLLRNQSSISASAAAQATGGNISFNAPEGFIIALPFTDSDIIAQADQGRGGVITFEIAGIYGLEQRDALPNNNTNDISVNSASGQAGTITINDLAADPSRSRTELPESVLDARNLIDRSCSADVGQGRNSFVVTGRGGLPPSPADIVRSDNAGLADFGAETDTTATGPVESVPESAPTPPQQIVEAQTWYRNASGTAVLASRRPDRSEDFSLPVQTFCDRR